MDSSLSEKEKLYVRSTVIECRMQNRKCYVMKDLLKSIQATNGYSVNQVQNLKEKLAAAKLFKRNCFARVHRPCASIPAHFKSGLFLGKESLSQGALKSLKTCFNQCKQKQRTNLGHRITSSKASTWKVCDFKSIQSVINESK